MMHTLRSRLVGLCIWPAVFCIRIVFGFFYCSYLLSYGVWVLLLTTVAIFACMACAPPWIALEYLWSQMIRKEPKLKHARQVYTTVISCTIETLLLQPIDGHSLASLSCGAAKVGLNSIYKTSLGEMRPARLFVRPQSRSCEPHSVRRDWTNRFSQRAFRCWRLLRVCIPPSQSLSHRSRGSRTERRLHIARGSRIDQSCTGAESAQPIRAS